MEKKRVNKNAQLALFIIFGILIVIGIIALFLVLPKPEISVTSLTNSLEDIKPCISKSLSDVLPEFTSRGLYFNPVRTLIYKNEEVSYHCFTSEKRRICERNDAQDKTRIENELENKISENVEECFNKFRNANRGQNIDFGQTDLQIEILPGQIEIRTRKELSISREGEEPERYNNFDAVINSPLWDFIKISNEILNQEVSCKCPLESCTADVIGLMRNNRDYKITFFIGGRDEKVYTIEDYYDQYKLKFAVKNCDKTP